MIDSVRKRKFHQVATVRRRERLSLINAARLFKLPKSQVACLEDEYADLPISVLCRWAQIMNVPVTELLPPDENNAGRCVWDRARMVRLMKTVESVRQSCDDSSIDMQLSYIRRQLVEMMPELEEITAHPRHEHNRRKDDYGAVVRNLYADPFGDDEG